MRILQIAPIWERVPPPAYGGTEVVVSALTEGLVARGHEVVLYASGDSETSAELVAVYPESLRTTRAGLSLRDKLSYEALHAAVAIGASGQFDIVHNHAGESVAAMAVATQATCVLSTFHCLTTPHTLPIWQHYRGYFNTISHAAASRQPRLERARDAGVVYNGINVQSFPFSARKDDYLLHLSRISPEKGTHLAIDAALLAGARLVIAGKVDPVDVEYFETVVRPRLNDPRIQYVGEVTRLQSKALYLGARALLLPLQWEEPFGLVMPEALACGTPVIAFPRGSAPEIIRDGETGFLVADVPAMAAAIERVGEISPSRCRADVKARFDVDVMVDGYEAVYHRMRAAQVPHRAVRLPRTSTPVITAPPAQAGRFDEIVG